MLQVSAGLTFQSKTMGRRPKKPPPHKKKHNKDIQEKRNRVVKQKPPAWHGYIMQALRAAQRCLLVRVSSLPRGFVFSAVRFKPTQLTLMRLCCQWCLQDMKKHTHTHLLNSPVGSSEKQLKYSLIMDSALEQSGTTLKKNYIYKEIKLDMSRNVEMSRNTCRVNTALMIHGDSSERRKGNAKV